MNSLIVLKPGFFPVLTFFLKAIQSDVVVLADHLFYQKKTPVSRSTTLENPGHFLSIPVKHTTGHVSIYHKSVDYSERWIRTLDNTLQYYFDDLPEIYKSMSVFLHDSANGNFSLGPWLKTHIQILFSLIKPTLKIVSATEVGYQADHTITILHWLELFMCNCFIPIQGFTDNKFINLERLSLTSNTTITTLPLINSNSIDYLKESSILSFYKQYGLESGLVLRQIL